MRCTEIIFFMQDNSVSSNLLIVSFEKSLIVKEQTFRKYVLQFHSFQNCIRDSCTEQYDFVHRARNAKEHLLIRIQGRQQYRRPEK